MKFRLFQALTSHGILSFVFIGQGADGVKGAGICSIITWNGEKMVVVLFRVIYFPTAPLKFILWHFSSTSHIPPHTSVRLCRVFQAA